MFGKKQSPLFAPADGSDGQICTVFVATDDTDAGLGGHVPSERMSSAAIVLPEDSGIKNVSFGTERGRFTLEKDCRFNRYGYEERGEISERLAENSAFSREVSFSRRNRCDPETFDQDIQAKKQEQRKEMTKELIQKGSSEEISRAIMQEFAADKEEEIADIVERAMKSKAEKAKTELPVIYSSEAVSTKEKVEVTQPSSRHTDIIIAPDRAKNTLEIVIRPTGASTPSSSVEKTSQLDESAAAVSGRASIEEL